MTTLEKATRKDWLWPGVFLVLGVLGALVARQFFFQAFPEASIDLRISRTEITQRSDQFLRGRGFAPDAFRHVTVFDFDDQAKTYLERELGLEEANRVMASRVNIWRWRTRWIKPPEKEEFSVWLTPTGQLVGFEHQVEEKREGARLGKDEAQRIAEVFLRAERGLDLARFDLVTDDVQERPNRLDYTFTWQERDFRLKEARQRMSVTVLGDQVGGFREFLKIPEQWVRDYERLRSKNGVFSTIATALYVVLFVVAIVTIIRFAGRKRVPWKPMVAIASVVAILFMAEFWNEFGLNLRIMPTNVTFDVWTILYFLAMLLTGLFVAFYVLVLASSGEPLYRELAPDRIALGHLFTFRGLRTKEFFTSTLIGYGMAAMHIGLVVLFYVLARRLGAWAPLDVNYNNAISTALPWLSPLSTSVMAATTEEFAFRLFAIPLLLRWTKSKWIAVIVPAFVWGFLHSAYPQQPPWIRGVEVGLIGVVAGWVFLRFGILATLVWHYTVDAVLIGLFLLRSDNLSYRMAGALVGDVVLLPLVIAGVFYIQSRGFLRDERILNGAPEEEEELELPAPIAAVVTPGGTLEPAYATTSTPFTFISRSWLVRLGLAGVIGLLAAILVDVPRPGKEIQIRVGPRPAETAAIDHLQRRGVHVQRYRRVTWLEDDITGGPTANNDAPGSPTDYLVEHRGILWTARVYRDRVPAVFWHTRFFRPPQKEEYAVFVTPEGRVFRVAHQLDEKAPGARLDKPEALAVAERFLAQNAAVTRVRLDRFRLVEHDLERRDARNDHTLVWESKDTLVADATHRVTAVVKGDEPAGPRHWIKIPEEWQRRHTRPTLFTILPILLIVVVSLLGVVLFARAVPRVTVHWRAHIWLGIAGALFQLVGYMNTLPQFQQSVNTSVPWETSLLMFLLAGLMSVIFSGCAIAMLSAALETLLVERFGAQTWWPGAAAERGRALLQALAAGAAGALILVGVRMLLDLGAASIPSAVRDLSSGLPSFDAMFSPALGIVTRTVTRALWQTLLYAGLAAVLLRLFRDARLLVVALLAGTALMTANAPDAVAFVKSWVSLAVSVAVMAGLIRVLRFNLPAYLVLFVVLIGLGRVASVAAHGGLVAYAIAGGAGLLAVLAVVAVMALAQMRRESGELAPVPATTAP